MTSWLTLRELASQARNVGLTINERTLRLYVDSGLLPRPTVRNRSGGGRSGYYDPRVLDLLRVVLQQQDEGQTLEQVGEFLSRLAAVARRAGREPLDVQLEAAAALRATRLEREGKADGMAAHPTGPARSKALWAAAAGPLAAEMVRQGISPDSAGILELKVEATTTGGATVTVPLFLSPQAVRYAGLSPSDYATLGKLMAEYRSELTGMPQEPVGAERIARWVEKSYDISAENFVLARRQMPDGSGTLGFVALGVEPERLRAGQVRLEGPYVVPEYRSQGIGRALLRRAEQMALERGASFADAYLSPEANQAISFLKVSGYRPEFYGWDLAFDLKSHAQNSDPTTGPSSGAVAENAGRQRRKSGFGRLDIRPVGDMDQLRLALQLSEQVRGGRPGFYPPRPEDLLAAGLSFPMDTFFTAFLDGQAVASLWNSKGSRRIYVDVLPAHEGTWVEADLWKYLLRYAAGRGMEAVTTEVSSFSRTSNRVPLSLGFTVDRMWVCYRKDLKK